MKGMAIAARKPASGYGRVISSIRGIAFLLTWLVLPVLATAMTAGQALATDWIVNISDTGFDPMPSGGTVIYTVTVENEDIATSTAPANTVSLTIPATATFIGATGTITNCVPVPAIGPATIVCNVPALAGGSVATLQASVRTSTPGTVLVVASVPTLGIDSEPLNNVETQLTTVTNGTDINLSLSGPASAVSGSAATYIFNAANQGPLPASNIVITMPKPLGFDNIVAPAGCVFINPNYICTILGPVAVGNSANLAFSGQITAASPGVVTVAGSLTSSIPPDPIPGNNTATRTTTVTAGSDLTITKSRAPLGTRLVDETVAFTLSPSYSGEDPFNITVTDQVPANYRIDSVTPSPGSGWSCVTTGQLITCTRPSGEGPGANVSLGTISIQTTAMTAGTPTNQAQVTAQGPADPNPANNTANDGGVTIQNRTADLRADMFRPGNPPPLMIEGQSYDFGIRAANLGNQPFVGTLVMTHSLPAGLRLTGITPRGWACTPPVPMDGPATLVCQIQFTAAQPLPVWVNPGNLVTSPQVTLTMLATATGTVTNSMTVSSLNANFPDPNLANNTATNNAFTAGTAAGTDLQVIKTAASPVVASGAVQTFDIEIVNLGPVPSTSITLIDDLLGLTNNTVGSGVVAPPVTVANAAQGLTCAIAPFGQSPARLTCTIATLPVCTQGVTCPRISVSVRPGGDGGPRTNTAQAFSSTAGDLNTLNNTSVVEYTVTSAADVTVGKAVTPGQPFAGQPFTYVVTASTTADGRGTAQNVTVTDTLPPGLVFLSASSPTGSCPTRPAFNTITGAGNNQIVCNLGTIPNGEQRAVFIEVRPTTSMRGTTIANLASVTTTTAGDNPANNSFSLPTLIANPFLDLQINKSDSPDPVSIGETTVYTLDATNNGPSLAENVVVTDTLPANGLIYLSHVVPPDGSCGSIPAINSLGGTLRCYFPQLRTGESRTIQITMEAVGKGVVMNRADVASDETTLGFDTSPANNQDIESTTIRTRVDLTVTKTTASPTVNLLDPFNFTINVSNRVGAGLSEADNVALTDVLPAGMELTGAPTVSALPGTTTTQTCTGAAASTSFTCQFGTVSPGGEIIVTMPVRINSVTSSPQTVVNTASVATSSLDIDPSNNQGSATVSVTPSSLAGLVFRDFNNNGVMNVGDTAIAGATLTLTGNAFDSSAVNLSTTTAANGSYVFYVPTGTYTVTRGAVPEAHLTNGIAIPGTSGGTASGATSISSINLAAATDATGYNFTLIPTARIGVAKAVQSGPAVNGDGSFDITFRLRVNNLSLEDLANVVVTDVLQGAAPLFGSYAATASAAGTYTMASAPSGTCGGLNAGFNGAGSQTVASGFTLAAGAICSIDIALRVMPTDPPPELNGGARYLNQAQVTGEGGVSGQTSPTNPQLQDLSHNGTNADPNGNGIANEPGENDPTPVSPTGLDVARLGISKLMSTHTDVDGDAVVSVGDTLAYTITATNTGNTTQTDVLVTDSLLTPSSATCASVAAGGTCVLTGSYVVTGADADAGTVNNTAQAASTEVTTPVTATTSTPVTQLRSLAIAKVANPAGPASVGDTLAYTITATNTGNTTQTDVLVTDSLITPNANTCASVAAGGTCVLTGSYVVTGADADAGTVDNTAEAESTEVTTPVTASISTPVIGTIDPSNFTMSALVSTVKRGERVPFVIRAVDVPLNPARIAFIMPPGFALVDGSATANGAPVGPVVDGRSLTFDGLTRDAAGGITLELTLAVTAGAATGDSVNQAQLIRPLTGDILATARVRVTVLEEAVFDCSDVIGKVFDDENRNGYQDEGEPGLPGVRLATVKGLLITTDRHGRFSIACADIPDQDIGSNFIVKLDPRTLPTGYRVTTENPRKVRLTRGKIVKLNFGAAITRLVSLDLNSKVFEQGSDSLQPKWQAGLGRLVEALAAEPSTLRITFVGEDGKLTKARMKAVRREIERRWSKEGAGYRLQIETRVTAASGEAGQ